MAFTQIQLDALDNAIAMGVKKVKYGDKETEYQSIADMIALRDVMKSEIAGVSSIQERRTQGIFKSTTNRNRWDN